MDHLKSCHDFEYDLSMTNWNDEQLALDLAGMTLSAAGLPHPQALYRHEIPPRISIDGDYLVWSNRDENGDVGPRQKVQPSGKMLDEFVRLEDASSEKILSYANRWGVLAICDHNLPSSHSPNSYGWQRSQPVSSCISLGLNQEWVFEPLETWKQFAKEARAVRNMAAQLHQEQRPHSHDIEVLIQLAAVKSPNPSAPLLAYCGLVSRTVNDWLNLGNVRPWFRWTPKEGIAIAFGSGLFSSLAVQLMTTVSRMQLTEFCSACALPYSPKRRPRQGENHYCDDCGRKAAVNEASKRYRRKKAAKKADTGAI